MPHTILHSVAGFAPAERSAIPFARWTALAAFAAGGSLLYGGSLALVLPGWNPGAAALWLTLSAGLAWCVFLPALRACTGLRWGECVDAGLVTMAFGEVVLVSGALANALLWRHGVLENAALINWLIVALSNAVMAAGLALLLRPRGVAIVRTLALWMLALNGSGAVFFAALYRALLIR